MLVTVPGTQQNSYHLITIIVLDLAGYYSKLSQASGVYTAEIQCAVLEAGKWKIEAAARSSFSGSPLPGS